MGLLLSVFAGTHICPDGGESLARICRAKPFGRGYQAAFYYYYFFSNNVADHFYNTATNTLCTRKCFISACSQTAPVCILFM